MGRVVAVQREAVEPLVGVDADDQVVAAGDPLAGAATLELVAGSDLQLNAELTASSVVLRAGNTISQAAGSSLYATNLGLVAAAAPVLNIGEAYQHPHNVERQTFVEVAGRQQPAGFTAQYWR